MSPPAASDLTPDPALIARFRADLEALTGEPPTPARRLGVAVSGGGDSLALLLLAAAAYPGAVVAATVDHGLRPEAAAEAAGVAAICGRLGVDHDVLLVPEGALVGGNLQECARNARYGALAEWAAGDAPLREAPRRAPWIATGHQRDDVAETFLMRARRGAGVGGLAAMAAIRPVVPWPMAATLLRPLLGWSRADLAAVVRGAGLEAAADPSNADPRFERARTRALLAAAPALDPAGLARAAHNLRDAEEALAWAVEREWDARSTIEEYEAVLLDVSGLPHEVRRRLVDRALDHVRSEFNLDSSWRGAALERLIRLLDDGCAATLGGVLVRPGHRWRFTLAPARRTG